MITVAVEIGGTFTDLVMAQDGEVVRTVKVPSTPRTPEKGALNAVDALGLSLDQVSILSHGSTVATNAVLERKGARMVLLVTEGFRDMLEIQREEREDLYNLHYRKPTPLVPRDRVLPVRERLAPDGEVVVPLDERQLIEILDSVFKDGIDAVAVCLLHSYRHSVHEDLVHKIIRDRYAVKNITLSSRILPEFREYERASTTILNAYVAPIMERYVESMEDGLRSRRFDGSFRVVQSNGGVLPARHIADHAVRALLSGPAAGVIGATHMAATASIANVITFDMGGTSTDVCLVTDGRPEITTGSKIDGWPVRVPMIDIVSVGAGGGSIARVEAGRLLRVGPQSAGADPGPACYSKGGAEATVTDANLLLGRIRPNAFFGGRMPLAVDRAEAVIQRLADLLGATPTIAAESVVKVANATMAQAIRLVSIERGHDPRDYTIVAFGGAGPLHAVALADELDAPRVLVPVNPGVLSAFGLLVADFKRDYVRTLVQPGSTILPAATLRHFQELEEQAVQELAEYHIPAPARRVEYSVDMRYFGQAFELNVPVDIEQVRAEGVGPFLAGFHKAHEVRYGHSSPDEDVELVNYRVVVSVAQQDIRVRLIGPRSVEPDKDVGRVFADGRWQECHFYSRPSLAAGDVFGGPAVVEEESATTFIPADWIARVDPVGNLHITRR